MARTPAVVAVTLALIVLAALGAAPGTLPAAAQQTEAVPLFAGCNNVSLTWPAGTPMQAVAAAVTPSPALVALWRYNPGTQRFEGFAPQFPEVSDLTTVGRLDAVFICMDGPGTLARPGPGAAGSTAATPAAAPLDCLDVRQIGYHVHAHLAVFVEGRQVAVPANIGLRPDCIAPLHTHEANGMIHVEGPAPRPYTLGDFFRVWGQRLDATHLLERAADGQQQVMAHVNGQPYQGPPESIPLAQHTTIVLQYGPPFVPPPPYRFPPGF